MFKLESFAKILEEKGFGKLGENIFVNIAPVSKPCILLLEQSYGSSVDINLPEYYKDSGFQVIIRDKSFEKTREISYNIMDTLTIKQSKQIDNLWVNMCYPRSLPTIYGVINDENLEGSINFALNYVNK